METTEALATTDVNHANNPATRPIAREPRPPYNQGGEAPGKTTSSSSTLPAGGPEARPVTVATARERKLWREGILIYEDASGRLQITEIDEDLTAYAEPSVLDLEQQPIDLRPEQTLTFVPDSETTGDNPGHISFDEIDTREALRHVRSALENAESLDRRPVLAVTLKRHLRCARQLLEDHADRNGFNT